MMQESVQMSPSSTHNPDKELYFAKLVIAGECGVGKTSLLRAFCDKDFSTSYMSTIGVDFRILTLPVDDIDVKITIWDTAGGSLSSNDNNNL